MSGNFLWTLCCCDVATQWVEMRPAWNRGAHAVGVALEAAFGSFPLKKRRENARWIKRFEKEPKTPAQRVLESPDVCEADKQRVRDLLAANDFLTLRRRKEKLLFAFTRQGKLLDSQIIF